MVLQKHTSVSQWIHAEEEDKGNDREANTQHLIPSNASQSRGGSMSHMCNQDLNFESTLWAIELMKLNQVLLCHHWSVYVLFICIASMMLEWVQSWALANQSINIHHYEYMTLKHRTTYQAKNYLFYSCFEPLLMLGRQSASVLNFLMLHFFVTTFIYLLEMWAQ